MTIKFHYKNQPDAKAVLIPIVKNDDLPEVLSNIKKRLELADMPLEGDFKAEAKEIQPLYSKRFPGSRFFLLGMGADPTFGDMLNAFRSFAYRQRKKLSSHLTVDFLVHTGKEAYGKITDWVEAAANGLLLGGYQIGLYKTKKQDQHPLLLEKSKLSFWVEKKHAAKAKVAANRGKEVAETQMSVFDLVNAPGNKAIPSHLAIWAKISGKKAGYKVKIFGKKRIKEVGLEALVAVNRGSEYPPAFIVMEYQPKKKTKKLPKIGLVGKGVTFDTGGLSLKGPTNMHFMKSDMGGAAAVLGAMELIAKLQLPVHVVGIVPATDNCVDSLAVKPGDVIDSYSGKTIEVIDTDAEGRLVLADGLAYLNQQYKPDVMVDLATLTGSAIRAFGYHAAAMFSNNDKLARQLFLAGEASGERMWQLPIWDVYKEDLRSDVADVKNYSGRPLAGAIGAAKFLEAFIEDHAAWAHLDIAGVAFKDSEFSYQKSSTGYGIRLLVEFISRFKNIS